MNTKIVGIFLIILLIAIALPSKSGLVIKRRNFSDMQNYEFVPGEFIVKLINDTTISSPTIMILNEKYQVSSIEKVLKNTENTILDNIYILRVPDDYNILSIVNDYSSNPYVEYAEPNYLIHLCGIPNDEEFSKQWALHNIGQLGGTPDADIDAPKAWDIETGSSDVTIAIIDTGVDYTHPDLADNIWINENEIPDNQIDDDNNGFVDDNIGWDFVGESIFFRKPDNDPLDDFGHGTHCAGLASAVANNNNGIAGICWDCKIMCVRIGGNLGLVNLLAVVEGIVYAVDNGADIISMSFGGLQSIDILDNAISYAHGEDVILVAGAGNIPWDTKFYPASYNSVIGVAATDMDDKLAFFSTYGNWVDVAAPGVEIYSTMPTYHVTMNTFGIKKNFDYLEGTSMSCPIVAGLAALLKSYDPNLTPEEIRIIINDSTDWIKTNRYIGNGRINAHKALLIAAGITIPPNKPETPSGPTNGKTGTEYTYTTISTDPDGNDLYYLFDWDDGTFSEWEGPFASGAIGSATHKWIWQRAYNIKVKTRDSYGIESEWSDPLSINMHRNRVITLPFLNFLKNHPNMFSILQQKGLISILLLY